MLLRAEKKRVCEICDCDTIAECAIVTKRKFKYQIYLCEECLKKLFKHYMGTTPPKAISSPFKPNSRITKEKK